MSSLKSIGFFMMFRYFFGKDGDIPFQEFRLNYFDIDAERQNNSAQP